MIFSSPEFLAFFALLLGLLALPWALHSRKRIVILASCFFYATWDIRYVPLLLGVTLVDYLVGRGLAVTEQPRRRRYWLACSLIVNLSVLGFFKYVDFFIGNVNSLIGTLGIVLPYQHIVLPVGISFYTFMSMSYSIDVYRRKIEPLRSLRRYLTFMTFFPSMIAGPIVRASEFLPQLDRPLRASSERLMIGGSIFVLGLIEKRVVADRLAQFADPIFADPGIFDTATLWLGTFAYSGQIFCDFSAYSMMAIGVAKCLGIDLPQNFRLPYLSTSISEFWRRWHMTLSFWLRDYLYISLGGSRQGRLRTLFALSATMLLGGLWHGASWNFVLWGGLHGLALVLHRIWKETTRWRLPPVLGWLLTFVFVSISWVPFRADGLETTLTLLQRMLQPSEGASFLSPIAIGLLLVIVLAHGIGRLVDRGPDRLPGQVQQLFQVFGLEVHDGGLSGRFVIWNGRTVASWWLLGMLAYLFWWFSVLKTSPFVYFQF